MRKLIIAIIVCIASISFAQDSGLIYHYVSVQDEFGAELPITSITIYVPYTSTPATIYKDGDDKNPITQPITPTSTNTTITSGHLAWWGPDGWGYAVTADGMTQTSSTSRFLNAAHHRIMMFSSTVTDAELAALAALVSDANMLPYFTGLGAAALLPFSPWAQGWMSILDANDGLTYQGWSTWFESVKGTVDAAAFAALLPDPGTDPNIVVLEGISGPWQRIVTDAETNADILSAKPQLHLDHVYDVRDYGAIVGDSIDDTNEIQAAIDVAFTAGGGTVRLMTGIYNTSGKLVMKTGVTLEGDGASIFSSIYTTGNTRIFLRANSDCDMVQIAAGTKNTTIRSIYWNGNGANQSSGDGISQEGATCSIEDCKVCYCKEVGIRWSGTYGYIWKTDCVYNYQEGLYVSGYDLYIYQSEFQDSDYADTSTYPNVTITDGPIFWCGGRTGSDNSTNTDGLVLGTEANNCAFVGLYFENNDRYALYNQGDRNRFTNCYFLSPAGGDDAVVESGANNLYSNSVFWVENTNYPFHITGGSGCTVSNSKYVKGGTVGFSWLVDGGFSFTNDGTVIQPIGSGDDTAVLEINAHSATDGDGGTLRFNTTWTGTSGVGIRGVRDSAGAYGSLHFWTRGADGENDRLVIDQNGIITPLKIGNDHVGSGSIKLYEDSDNGTSKATLIAEAAMSGDKTYYFGATGFGIGETAPTHALDVVGEPNSTLPPMVNGIPGNYWAAAVAKTASYSIPTGTAGNLTYTNTGAGAAITITLQPATVGLRYRFLCTVDYDISLDPNAAETFYDRAAGEILRLDDKACYVEIQCIETGKWAYSGSDPNL